MIISTKIITSIKLAWSRRRAAVLVNHMLDRFLRCMCTFTSASPRGSVAVIKHNLFQDVHLVSNIQHSFLAASPYQITKYTMVFVSLRMHCWCISVKIIDDEQEIFSKSKNQEI